MMGEPAKVVWEFLTGESQPIGVSGQHSTGFSPIEFSAQCITGSLDPPILDELWRLVSANILRPSAGLTQFMVTTAGEEVLRDKFSPYTDAYHYHVTQNAPLLNDDSNGYLKLALLCLISVPAGALALFRAGLETEINSLVEIFESSSKSSRRTLHRRDLKPRISELVNRLRSRQVLDDEDLEEFVSCCTQIRIPGNNVLHPAGGLPIVDVSLVTAVSHSFRRMAELSSKFKSTLAKN